MSAMSGLGEGCSGAVVCGVQFVLCSLFGVWGRGLGGMRWYCGGGWCGLIHAACLCGKAGLFPRLPFGCCGD